jgi:hypothetical protein
MRSLLLLAIFFLASCSAPEPKLEVRKKRHSTATVVLPRPTPTPSSYRKLKESPAPQTFADEVEACNRATKWYYRRGFDKKHKWIGAFETEAECEVARTNDDKFPKWTGSFRLVCERRYSGPTRTAKVTALRVISKSTKHRGPVTYHFSEGESCEEVAKGKFIAPGVGSAQWEREPVENEYVSPAGSTEFPVVSRTCNIEDVVVCETDDPEPKSYQFFE